MHSIKQIWNEMTTPHIRLFECMVCRETMTTLDHGTPKSCPNCHAPQAAIRVYRATPRNVREAA